MAYIIQLLGYIGSILILISFIFVTRGKWKPQSKIYLFCNLIGALLLAIYQVWLGAYAGVLLNIVFASIAVLNLWQFWSAKSKPKNKHRP
jgi:uncharacterized membrane protein